jgi:ribonuclease VapC
MTAVVDASALLAFVQGEEGSDRVEAALESGVACGAANWSEVAQKVIGAERDWELVRALLASYALSIEPVTTDDAEWAARRWRRGEGLSLADRLCLALGARRDAVVLTADATWGSDDRIRQIR